MVLRKGDIARTSKPGKEEVEFRASLHSGYYPGVPTSLVDGLGIMHFVYADRTLDVASNSSYPGLGITPVKDLRGEVAMISDGARR